MSNYFSDERFFEIDYCYGSTIEDEDFNIFVGIDIIPECDENCIVILNNCDFELATKCACISLERPEYYLHGKMEGIEDWVLNKEEKARLMKLLQKPATWWSNNCNAYQALIDAVNDYNGKRYRNTGFSLPLDYPMPDYMLLPE